jgi:hypothetical protein
MCNRVRSLKSTDVNVFLNGLNYRTNANLYTLDEVAAMFDAELQHRDSFVSDENGDLIEKDSVFKRVRQYNYLEQMHKNPYYFIPHLVQLLSNKGQEFEYDNTSTKRKKCVVNITKQNILEAKDIDDSKCLLLIEKQESNEATSKDKYEIERFMLIKDWKIEGELTDEKLSKCFRRTHILYNNQAINNKEVKQYKTVDDDYADIDVRIKIKKLQHVNEMLKLLGFKDDDNEFTGKCVTKEAFSKLEKKVKTKSKLFVDKNVQLLFGLKKKTINSTKGFLGLMNSILANYGVKIDHKRTKINSKLSYKYFIK